MSISTATGSSARGRARVHLPLALREEAGGVRTIEVDCARVSDALATLVARHPTMRRHLFDETGALRPHVNVFVNEADVRAREGLGTAVREGDEIHLVPSIAGG